VQEANVGLQEKIDWVCETIFEERAVATVGLLLPAPPYHLFAPP